MAIAITSEARRSEGRHQRVPAESSASDPRKYRGGFSTSICDIFRDPRRRTDCCAVVYCGVLSSDRSRYLLTGESPPPLWVRALAYLGIPAAFFAAMSYFTVEVAVEELDDAGGVEEETVNVAQPAVIWSFVVYIVVVVIHGCVKGKRFRKEILTRLYAERARERGEEVRPSQLESFLNRHDWDSTQAHCCSFCYDQDHGFYDESAGVMHRSGLDGGDDQHGEDPPEEDFCTRLWDYLSKTFWCCGCWCQCCGICAVAQEEREVDRLTGHAGWEIDFITFQPHSEYFPSIQHLTELQVKSPWKHLQSLSVLSSKILKNVLAVLILLVLFALLDIDSNFTWENMIVLLLTLVQAFFVEYLVHWRWNLFDLSLDSVVKYFACGFFLTTPIAIAVETIVSSAASFLAFILVVLVIASDSDLEDEIESPHPERAMKDLLVNYPGLFILFTFVNAFVVAALVEEIVKYFGYRMVVTPDLLKDRSPPSSSSSGSHDEETESSEGSQAKSSRSTGAGITVAMVSVALGFACCENLIYIFVYSPPSLGMEISTLLARSSLPVHPLCAAIQSIGVCKRDLEGDKKFGLGRIIFPAIVLHGSFDFALMVAAYFLQVEDIKEGNDDDAMAALGGDEEDVGDIVKQIPSMLVGLSLVIVGYSYYVKESRAQTQRLIAMDSASREQNSPLV